MKWQETVLPDGTIGAILQSSEGVGWEKAKEVAKEQAEISFKAGIKEAIDCLRWDKNLSPEPDKYILQCTKAWWEDKLKEWEVNA